MSENTLFGFSESIINGTLAGLLCGRGLISGAELVTRVGGELRRPDIMLNLQGFRIILEGKVDQRTARRQLEHQCTERINEDLCEISIGVIYHLPRPENGLFDEPTIPALKALLSQGEFEVAVWGPGAPEPALLKPWSTEDLGGLASTIRDAVHEAHAADVLSDAVSRIESTLAAAASALLASDPKSFKNLAEKLATPLELPKPKTQQEFVRTVKMGFLVLLDAAIFYNVLQPQQKELSAVENLKRKHGSYSSALARAFEKALTINYEAVFEISAEILSYLPPEAEPGVAKVAATAFHIGTTKVLLKHDLMGRVFHTLLFEKLAKHLATYYTAVTSAWLLAKLTTGTPGATWSDDDMSDIERFRDLRVCDFACGSGTLLSAMYGELDRLYTDAVYRSEGQPDRDALHTALLDEIISGYDVMLYAAHIATLTLAMHNPESIFREGHIYVLPFGDKKDSTGSLEFLVRESQRARTTATKAGVKEREIREVRPEPHSYDVVIMNPPFARSCGDNLLFGSITDKKKRNKMKKRLTDILVQSQASGIGHAGLGAIFVYLADKFVKPGGRIAFVLPRNVLSGVSWTKIRELLVRTTQLTPWQGRGYHVEYIMVSVDADNGYNFSENTDLSECMFVARKLKDGEEPGRTLVSIIWRKPKTTFEARAVGRAMEKLFATSQQHDTFDMLIENSAGDQTLSINEVPMGRAYALSPHLLTDNTDNWGRLCAFAVPALTRVAYKLRTTGEFSSTNGLRVKIPLKPLVKMFEVGPDRRQIHDSFVIDETGAHDALWGRDVSMNTLSVRPNSKVSPKPGVDPTSLVAAGSRVVITERIRLDTTPLPCLLADHPVLSNVWWTLLCRSEAAGRTVAEKAWTLWFNCTAGLLLQFAELQVTEGGWAATKKASLEALPALDLNKLSDEQVAQLAQVFDDLSSEQVPVLSEQFAQAAEGQGWRFRLDTRLLEILSGDKVELRHLRPLYNLLIEEAKHW